MDSGLPTKSLIAEQAVESRAIDVLAIGALNLDYIATPDQIRRLSSNVVVELQSRFACDAERSVQEEEIDAALLLMANIRLEPRLGGSGLNMIRSLAHMNTNLQLSYLGVAGDVDISRLDFLKALSDLRINASLVSRVSGRRSGVCVSYVPGGRRSLLTFPGANALMANHLENNYTTIIATLCRAKFIHVTSFLDPQTPAALSEILTKAKNSNPDLTISLDPGYPWIIDSGPTLRALMMVADLVFLNDVEFRLLGRCPMKSPDAEVARSIYSQFPRGPLTLVVKRKREIVIIKRPNKELDIVRYFTRVINPQVIADDTGAGDVFAAGCLAALSLSGMDLKDGVELGLRLVGLKLLDVDGSCLPTFARVLSALLERKNSNK